MRIFPQRCNRTFRQQLRLRARNQHPFIHIEITPQKRLRVEQILQGLTGQAAGNKGIEAGQHAIRQHGRHIQTQGQRRLTRHMGQQQRRVHLRIGNPGIPESGRGRFQQSARIHCLSSPFCGKT